MGRIAFLTVCFLSLFASHSYAADEVGEACAELLSKASDYENGKSGLKDESKAFSCYLAAAEKYGKDQALNYLKEKAESGNTCAQYYLGRYYGNDELDSCDPEKAFFWYSKAAEKKYPPALYYAARSYIDALGTEKNTKLGGEFLQEAAELGYRDAQTIAARYYTNFLEYYTKVYSRNYPKALHWFSEAAKQGSLESEFDMGVCYFHGLGARDNKAKAFEIWNSMLEELDKRKDDFDPILKIKLIVALSRCYYNGWGCKADEKKSMELLRRVMIGSEDNPENKKYLEIVKGNRRYELVNFSFKPNL